MPLPIGLLTVLDYDQSRNHGIIWPHVHILKENCCFITSQDTLRYMTSFESPIQTFVLIIISSLTYFRCAESTSSQKELINISF